MCLHRDIITDLLSQVYMSVNREEGQGRGRVNSESDRDVRIKCGTELEGETKEERRITSKRGSGLKKDREGVMMTKSTKRGTNGWKCNEVHWKQEEGESGKG